MLRKIFFHLFLSSAIAGTVYAFSHVEDFFAQSGTHLAILLDHQGAVRVRPADLSLWRDINTDSDLYDGQVISTGRRSIASLFFDYGKQVDLGQNSLLALNLDKPDEESSILVLTLLQGTANIRFADESTLNRFPNAKQTTKKNTKTILRSGSTRISLGSESSSIDLIKLNTQELPGVRVNKGFATLKTKKMKKSKKMKPGETFGSVTPLSIPKKYSASPQELIHAYGPKIAYITPTIEKVQALPPKINASDFRITWPRNGSTYWTTGSAKSLQRQSIELMVSRPEANLPEGFSPTLTIIAETPKSLKTKPRRRRFSRKIRLATLLEPKISEETKRIYNHIPLKVKLAPFATQQESNKPNKITTYFNTFANLPGKSIEVGLTNIRKKWGKGWIEQRPMRSRPKISIHLRSKKQIPQIQPLLRGATSFAFKPTKTFGISERSIYIANRSGVLAKIRASSYQKSSIGLVRRSLGGIVAFQGKGSAYLGTGTDIRKVISKIRRIEQKEFYIYNDGQLISIKKEIFFEQNSALASILNTVQAFFSSKVVIIDAAN